MPRLRVPHTLVLLFGMSVVALLLTYVLPQGEYERVENEKGRLVVVADSYQPIPESEAKLLSPAVLFTAIPKGFEKSQEIIFFIFLIGGCFAVFRATGAADAGIGALLGRLGHRPAWLLAGGMLVFGIGSSTIGMAEEYLPFVPVLLALCAGLGFDAVTAVAVLCVGYAIGYGTAAFNPFTVLIAQNVAQIPESSGLVYRLILFPVFFAVGFHHVLRYARRVQRDPSASLVADVPIETSPEERSETSFTWTHVCVLAITLGTIALIVVGLKLWDWYIVEMGAIFVALSIVLAAVARLGVNRWARDFSAGAAELTTTALLVGFARTIQVILDDGKVVYTIIYDIAAPLEHVGRHGAAVGMFLVQSLCNFFIPSGSGQAYVTMPIMAPLAEQVHVEKQVAVLAYQFGDGFTNIVVPTNAVLIGILTMARVPFDRWLCFVLPLMLKFVLIGSLALVIAVWFGYSGDSF